MARHFSQLRRVLRDIQSYRRLRIRSYAVPEPLEEAPPAEVLAAFMGDDAYNSIFLAPETLGDYDLPHLTFDTGGPPRHGPFTLDRLALSDYVPLPLAEVKARLARTLAEREVTPLDRERLGEERTRYYADSLDEVSRLLGPIQEDEVSAFFLDVDPMDARYMNTPFAPHSEFEEYVLIGRAGQERTLDLIVVMSA